jgi:uncharacterized lipoprotein YehR (DUF1307 family)
MEDNLNYTQMQVDFEKLKTTSLDQLDGLHVKGSESHHILIHNLTLDLMHLQRKISAVPRSSSRQLATTRTRFTAM